MRRISVSLNDTLDDAFTAFLDNRPDAPAASDVMRTALCEYLAARGYIQSSQPPDDRNNPQIDNPPSRGNAASQDRTMETIEAYIVASEAVPPTPTAVLAALRRYLETMGVIVPEGPLRTPQFSTLEDESGHTDTSVEHDRVLAEMHR
jgi:hypothetical protein